MTAGFRMYVTVHQINQMADDVVGGAVLTGTVSYPGLPATVEYLKPSMLLLEQGIETRRYARILVQPGRLVIRERDEVEVTGPIGHEDVGNRFRIDSVSRTGFSPNDARRILVLTAERIEIGRSVQ